MRKPIPFELFGKKEKLEFTTNAVIELELLLGKSVQQIMQSQNAGFHFCVSALPLCLKRLNPHVYIQKIEQYLSEDDRTIDDIAIPIIHALCAHGALGTARQKNALKIYYPELYPEEEEEEEEEEPIKNE